MFKPGQVVVNKRALATVEDVSDVRVVLKVISQNEDGYRLVTITKEQADRLGLTLEQFMEKSLLVVDNLNQQDIVQFTTDLKKLHSYEV